MPMIWSPERLRPAFLSFALCLAPIGCDDGLFFSDTTRPIGGSVILEDWLGEYDGTATARVILTGSVYSDVSSHLEIGRISEENVDIRLSVAVSPRPDDLEEIGDFTGGPFDSAGIGWRLVVPGKEIVLSSSATVTYEYANRRNRLSLTRSGEGLSGFLYVDFQETDGSYEVVGEIEVHVIKQP